MALIKCTEMCHISRLKIQYIKPYIYTAIQQYKKPDMPYPISKGTNAHVSKVVGCCLATKSLNLNNTKWNELR